MTFTLTFVNKGEIDVRAITTFGVNVKDNDSAIGYFGTGLKYAISILLRNECSISIYTGKDKYHFAVEDTDIRGKKFGIITMNGQPLGFTTEVGKNWELWEAFRELYCNAKDEDGYLEVNDDDDAIRMEEGYTYVVVRGHPLKEVYDRVHEIILPSEPIVVLPGLEIHPGASKYLYNKGIRIYKWNKPSYFTYNITRDVELTENRTLKFEFDATHFMSRRITNMDKADILGDTDILEQILLCGDSYIEHRLDFAVSSNASAFMLETADRCRLKIGVNSSVHNLLIQHAKTKPPTPVNLTEIQQKQLQKAITLCKHIGYAVDTYPIVVSDRLQGGIHGLAENNTIYLSPDAFGMGTKYVAATLLEEYLHLHTGYGDMTRELQNYLFNVIVSLGEVIVGEPI